MSELNRATHLWKDSTNKDMHIITTAIPTGTVGGLLLNIKLYDEAHAKGDEEAMTKLEQAPVQPLPTLKTIGISGTSSLLKNEVGY